MIAAALCLNRHPQRGIRRTVSPISIESLNDSEEEPVLERIRVLA
jgi:hypothetical protein